MVRWFPTAAMSLLAAALLGGCVGYHLGDSTPLPFHSICVAPPVNASLAPQSAALLGTQVARELDRSGRVAIAGSASADTTLQIRITDLHREPTVAQRNDSGLARRWRETLTAQCTLTDARSGRVYFQNRVVTAFDEVYSDSGLVPAEYQNTPVLTGHLAENIAREVLAVW